MNDSPENAAVVAWASQLAEFDEAVRQGRADESSWLTISEPSGNSTPPSQALDCLRLLEKTWPRSGRRSTTDSTAPKRVGRFLLDRLLGYGGFGMVYLAEDPVLRRRVALKVPRAPLLLETRHRERFLREGRTAAALNHPHLIPVFEAGEADGVCYLVAEYCEGPNLAQWLRGEDGGEGRGARGEEEEIIEGERPVECAGIDPRDAAEIVMRLADAVEHAHQHGILHRDIKPANVMLDTRGPSGTLPFTPRLTDFGLARLIEMDESYGTATGAILGTPHYMSPEQAAAQRDLYGPATDVYGLGVVLYELVAGRPPLRGEHPAQTLQLVLLEEAPPLRKLAPAAPRAIEAICLKCLQKDPRARYATAAEFRDDVARYLAGQAVLARQKHWIDPLVAWCQHPSQMTSAGLFTMIFGGLSIVWVLSVLLAVYLGAMQVTSSVVVYAYGATMVLVMYAPWVFFGWHTLHGRQWAMWATIAGAATMFVLLLQSVLSTNRFDVGGVNDDSPQTRWITEMLFTCLYFVVVVMNTLAIVACRANRRRLRPLTSAPSPSTSPRQT